jgi:ABC-type transport system involved in cytochrome c biogenesis permease subunit
MSTKRVEVAAGELQLGMPDRIKSWLPIILPILVALAFILIRWFGGERGFLYEGALTMLAFICYVSAAVLLVTNLFVKEEVLGRLGLLTTAMGYSFGLSGWMIRWREAYELELSKAPHLEGQVSLWRYFPLDNLYSLTLGFCCGAVLATLVVIRKPAWRSLGALSMPIVSVILALNIFLGNEIRPLPPILDSYWRPIHVSIATISYGVCLLSFGIAVAYLLKDGVKTEALAIAMALYGLLVYGTVGRFRVPFGEYAASLVIGKTSYPVRAVLPAVGPLMLVTALVILSALILFIAGWRDDRQGLRKLAWRAFSAAAALQALVLAVLFYQIHNVRDPIWRIPEREYAEFGPWLAKNMELNIPINRQIELAHSWVSKNAASLRLSVNSNPVEFGALLGLFVALVLVLLIARKREEVNSQLPSLQTLDSLLYKTVGVAFPGLTLLLITGAVWANESWGRYWGWDPKEVGALVAWMAYAGYLHTRIAHGWRGRRSAYFALLGFVLVIFTWLGVSYLLPGLHSYA